MTTEPINLFWTSGWDSTYRLLYLIFVVKKQVQPIYIIEHSHRASVSVEIQTMNQIREEIGRKDPEAAKHILPTLYKNLQDINIDEQISEAFEKITKKQYLGGQYVYLASFAKEFKFKEVEMSIIKQGNIFNLLSPVIEEFKQEGLKNYHVAGNFRDSEIFEVFGYFSFPVIYNSKTEIRELAVNYGFIDILEHSWSCHSPLPGNIPCGICPPCCYAIEEGFAYRFPEESLKRYRKSIKRRIYSMLRDHPLLFYTARHIKGFIKGKKNIVR